MSRPTRVLLLTISVAGAAAFATACGTEKIQVPKSDPTYRGAVLFSQRCSGCHTLSYAGTNGSAANVRSAMINNGPNFNVRCERPVTRVLYAIENGGFSGAIMPQNVVVGPEARAVAQFVSKYAGRQAPKIVGQTSCVQQQIGTLPTPGQTLATAAAVSGSGSKPTLPGTNIATSRGAANRALLESSPGRRHAKRAATRARRTTHP